MDALQSLFGAFFDISELPPAQGEPQHTPTPSLDACLQNQPSNTMGALGAVGNQDAWLLCALRWDVEWLLPRSFFSQQSCEPSLHCARPCLWSKEIPEQANLVARKHTCC